MHEARAAPPRAFGLMLVAVCVLVAFWPLFGTARRAGGCWRPRCSLAWLAWRAPQIFAIPNRAWMKLGELLARVIAPIALALLFYGLFVPMGWLLRSVGTIRCG